MSYISDLTTEAQTTVVNAVREGVFTHEELVSLVKELLFTESVHSIEHSLNKMNLELSDLDARIFEKEFEDGAWHEHKDLMNKGLI